MEINVLSHLEYLYPKVIFPKTSAAFVTVMSTLVQKYGFDAIIAFWEDKKEKFP